MREHGLRRHEAKQAVKEADMFAAAGLAPPPSIEAQVKAYRAAARDWLADKLRREGKALPFKTVWKHDRELQLRKTDAKQVCVDLAKEGLIKNMASGSVAKDDASR